MNDTMLWDIPQYMNFSFFSFSPTSFSETLISIIHLEYTLLLFIAIAISLQLVAALNKLYAIIRFKPMCVKKPISSTYIRNTSIWAEAPNWISHPKFSNSSMVLPSEHCIQMLKHSLILQDLTVRWVRIPLMAFIISMLTRILWHSWLCQAVCGWLSGHIFLLYDLF